MVMCFGGFIPRGVFRWLWCTVYMRHHLYLVSFIPCVLRGWRLIIFADLKKKERLINSTRWKIQVNLLNGRLLQPRSLKNNSSELYFDDNMTNNVGIICLLIVCSSVQVCIKGKIQKIMIL